MRVLEASIDPPTFCAEVGKKKAPTPNFAQHVAEMVEVHISEIRRYGNAQSQPTLDVIRKLAVALNISADVLLFEKDKRGPDEELQFQFGAISRLDPEEQKVIRPVIESIILRHDVRRWSSAGSEAK